MTPTEREAIRDLYKRHGDPADLANCVPSLLNALDAAEAEIARLGEDLFRDGYDFGQADLRFGVTDGGQAFATYHKTAFESSRQRE